jgi:hypothetical protein
MESTALPVLAIFGDDLESHCSGLRAMAGVHGAQVCSAQRSQPRDAGDVRQHPGHGHFRPVTDGWSLVRLTLIWPGLAFRFSGNARRSRQMTDGL